MENNIEHYLQGFDQYGAHVTSVGDEWNIDCFSSLKYFK